MGLSLKSLRLLFAKPINESISVFMSLANPITGGKLFPGFMDPDKWMKRAIRKLQRKTSNYIKKDPVLLLKIV